MADPKAITDGDIEAALRSSAGIYSAAADALGCTRQNIHQRVQGSPHLQAVCKDVRERLGDVCEGQIVKLINKGDKETVRWYAGMQLGARGYVKRMDHDLTRGLIDELSAAFGGDLDALRAFRAALTDS